MSSALARLAEDPEFHVDPPEGAERVVDDRYCVTIGSERRWAGVCRLRIADDPAAVIAVTGEILDLVGDIERTFWNVGSTAEPQSLPERLRALGWRDPEPPWDPVVAAMVLAEEPPAADGIAVRRIETFGDHLAGLEIMLASDAFSEEARARERAEARHAFERRMRRGGLQWFAVLDDEPVAFAVADRSPVGLYLAGGATLPSARGRGCYRALVRARWDEAVALGLPGLAVQAQYKSSAPILRRLGFVETATVHTLRSPASTDLTPGTSWSPGDAGAPARSCCRA
jgi:GNAT superfamily N-acetyltransferase